MFQSLVQERVFDIDHDSTLIVRVPDRLAVRIKRDGFYNVFFERENRGVLKPIAKKKKIKHLCRQHRFQRPRDVRS